MTQAPSHPPARSPAARAAARFALVYWLLYFPLLPVDRLPGFAWALTAYNAVWAAVVPFVARDLLGSRHDFPDTTELRFDCSYGYAHVALAVVLALLIAAAWSIAERGRPGPRVDRRLGRAQEIVRVLVRYGLANAMLYYGATKVWNTQFTPPALERFVTPLAEWSRMDLLWAFMGASPAYSLFGGALECVGGVLLFSRRTSTLGALVVAAVMANVVALNVAYDVPIKIHATHLLLMALYVALPDAARLGRVVLGGAADAVSIAPHFAGRRARLAATAAKTLFAVFLVASVAQGAVSSQRTSGADAARPVIYGIWEVESFTRDGAPWPALVTDGARWRRITFDRADAPSEASATLWRMTEEHTRGRVAIDEARRTLALTLRGATAPVALSYERTDGDHLVLSGRLDGVDARIALRRVPDESFKLRRGLRWLREHLIER